MGENNEEEFGQRVGWKLQKQDEELISEFCSEIRVQKQVFKVRLHNSNKKENSRRPTIDILPECLIQKILCFLSFKEAAGMSILSKIWLQAWSTLPTLKFTVYCWEGDIMIVDTNMERYRDGKIPIEKFELLDYSFSGNSHVLFPLIDKWLDIALQNGLKDLFIHFRSYPVPIFAILAVKSIRELVLEDCTLMPVPLSSGVVNCISLRKLSLSFVTLDENMFQTLLNSCPLIVSFTFEYCLGLEMIELVNLLKIKSVSLKVLKIRFCGGIWEIDAPNLVSFEYTCNQFPQLKILGESRQLKHSKIILFCLDNLNADWFCKLRKFLSNLTSTQVCIEFYRCNVINMKNLQLDHRGSTPQLDVLNVNCRWLKRVCPTFVDALVWSCHPRRLNLQSTTETVTIFIDRLMYMKNSNQLKEVKAYKFDREKESWHPVEHKSGELATRNLEERDRYYILLDW